jgi:hypothetical protein
MTQTPAATAAESAPDAAGGAAHRAPAPLRLWQRAVPVALLAVAAGGAFVAFGPSDEVAASATRERQQYVELQLTGMPQQVCGRAVPAKGRKAAATRTVSFPFRVTSRLEGATALAWSLQVDPRGARPAKVGDTGETDLQPGATAAQRARAVAPTRGAFDVRLVLADRPETLLVHCGGGR